MTIIYVDRDGKRFCVKIFRGARPAAETYFDSREAAEAFALSKLPKRSGMIVSTLEMTPDQWRDEQDRRERNRQRLAALGY